MSPDCGVDCEFLEHYILDLSEFSRCKAELVNKKPGCKHLTNPQVSSLLELTENDSFLYFETTIEILNLI